MNAVLICAALAAMLLLVSSATAHEWSSVPLAVTEHALLPTLFLPSGPPAVGRAVTLGDINPVECEAIGARAHVLHEMIKGTPAFADLDPLSSVPLEAPTVRIVAAAEHCFPESVFGPVNFAEAVPRHPSSSEIGVEAPARFDSSCS